LILDSPATSARSAFGASSGMLASPYEPLVGYSEIFQDFLFIGFSGHVVYIMTGICYLIVTQKDDFSGIGEAYLNPFEYKMDKHS